MDFATFFTARLQGTASPAGSSAAPQQAGGLNVALSGVDAGTKISGADANFFGQILSQIAAELEPQQQQPEKGQEHNALQSDNALLAKNPKLDLISLIGSTKEVQERIDANRERVDLGTDAEFQQALALNQQVNDEILMSLNGDSVRDGLSIPDAVNNDAPPSAAVSAYEDLIATDAPQIPTAISLINLLGDEKGNANKIETILKKIDRLVEAEDTSALSTIGFSPAQITRLQALHDEGKDLAEIYDALEASGAMQDALDALFQPPVHIAPPTAIKTGDEIIIPPQALPGGAQNNANTNGQENMAQIAARMNALVVGGSADEALVTSDINSVSNAADEGFERVLRDFGAKSVHNTPANTNAAAPAAAPAPQANPAAPASNFFQGDAFGVTDSLITTASYSADDAQGSGLSLNGQVNANSSTAIITQAHSAAQSHPATQMVAATLQRAGVNGQDANITLRLDPPELGRVDVRLRFGQDKNLKTVIRVENEDALHLLQRDSQALERALQNAGLDTSENGISFELSQDGDFGGDNERGGGHDGDGTGAGDDADVEILETTMNWHVDPDSGHVRYDLLV